MDNYHNQPDILDRTKRFSVKIVKLCNILPKTPVGFALAHQLIRSGTSIGANITEAQDAVSRPDFINKMSIALKESRETGYWLEIIMESSLLHMNQTDEIYQESIEIIKILRTIVIKLKK